MHVMLKRAAASAIPALVGLAVFPASAMAAPHTSRAAARATKVISRLVRATGTANTYRLNRTGAEFAATPAIPAIRAFHTSIAVPAYPDGGIARLARFSRVPRSAVGAPANGILNFGKFDESTGNFVSGTGGSGHYIFRNYTGSEAGATGTNGSQNKGNGAGTQNRGNGAGHFIVS